jgi:oligosaccharide repeat unit polymerase
MPVLLSGASWIAGGSPLLTDLAWVAITLLCLWFLALEMWRFPRRFGVGGIILYAGTLIWFCHDYLGHWAGADFNSPNIPFGPGILAEATFCHALFLVAMNAGLLLPVPRLAWRVFHLIPEPTFPGFYAVLVIALFVLGLLPYALFTSDPMPVAIWKEIVGGRADGASWTTGRSGNVNYDWGAYVAVLTQMGQIGGQLAVFYAILVARGAAGRVLGWGIWAFWVAIAFGSGNRGEVIFMTMPGVALLFLKHQALAAALVRRLSKRAYLLAGALAIAVLFLVQFQGYFRGQGYLEADLADMDLLDLQGSSMFSEGLLGYALIPEDSGFFYSRYPGESILRPLPDTITQFVTGPVPRALWHDKPIDPVWAWYNQVVTGSDSGQEGTTISQGLVGHWYYRYGWSGLLQGGLLLGWLLVLAERGLQHAGGKPMAILLSLVLATWLFRCFRGINFHNLYPVLIAAAGLWVIIHLQRGISGKAGPR